MNFLCSRDVEHFRQTNMRMIATVWLSSEVTCDVADKTENSDHRIEYC